MHRILVHTIDGKKWRSDAEDISDADMAVANSLFSNMTEMTNLNIKSEGQTVYFNPAHVVAVIIAEEN